MSREIGRTVILRKKMNMKLVDSKKRCKEPTYIIVQYGNINSYKKRLRLWKKYRRNQRIWQKKRSGI